MKFGNLFKRARKDKDKELKADSGGRITDSEEMMAMGAAAERDTSDAAALQEALASAMPDGLDIKTKLQSAEGKLYYMVKIINKTGEILGDVKVAIAPEQDLVTSPKPRKTVKYIDPGKSEVFRFKLQPSMMSGKTTIQGLIRFFDFKEKVPQEYLLPEEKVNITCPDITAQEVDEDVWRITMSKLKVYEIETIEMDFEPSKVFNHFTKIIEKMGFYQLRPNVVPSLFRGVGKFFGLDPLKEPYCVEVQVVGKGNKSRLLFRAWAPTITRSMGIAFRFLTKTDKKLNLRNNIVEKKKS